MKPELAEPYEHLLDSIKTFSNRIQTNNPRLLQTQVLTFWGAKDTFNVFEHLLRNHLRPMRIILIEEVKLQYIQCLLREEVLEFYQSLTMTTEKTLKDVLTKFRK